MYTHILIHGAYGNPNENWIPWLANSLREQGYNPLTPHFPTPAGHNFPAWRTILDLAFPYFAPKPIIIGHSIGAACGIDYMLDRELAVSKFISVAGFYEELGIEGGEELDEMNDTFFLPSFNIAHTAELADEVHCLYSDDDPYISLEVAERFMSSIQAPDDHQYMIQGGGHLNADSGFATFPQLLELAIPKAK